MARTKAFDPEDALDAAQRCFELRGYEATSVDDLVQSTGLSRASIYNAFGDKHRLFDAVLDRYEAQQHDRLKKKISQASSPREAIRLLLASTADSGSRLGCMVVNAGIELGPSDPAVQSKVSKSLEGIRLLFRDLLLQIPIEDAEATAAILEAAFLGLRVLARTGMPRKRILNAAAQTVEKLLPA